ncbi:hypothetical protein GAYE_SCF64G6722 [Galdieria yellowstonensis]|uniref:Mediator of RNA polymerase II transcription subunit 21 n=1 Tax=Galdieria yellowstonensis TaxID=3028027 RepID=A0AAV9IMY8_9RHOD|nr:hypothetical protein GAYE_SCF64G6722 [Galdieria yellowstonensis]
MQRLSDFLLHLDVVLRTISVDIFQGGQLEFPIQLDSSTADLDLDAVTSSLAASAKELDAYVASLMELQEPKAQKLRKKSQEAEIKLREVNKLLQDVVLELKEAEAVLTKALRENAFPIGT